MITDEAHRTQYDTLALNMRNALPNAAFLAFTGTPLIAGEERTREVFGDYVSIYNFRQSIEDGATVPLYYENRIPEVQLAQRRLRPATWQRILEEAELDEDQEKRLARRVRPRVPPDHRRRPARHRRRGHRRSLHRPRLSGQGDGRLHRQGDRGADVRQGADACGKRQIDRSYGSLDSAGDRDPGARLERKLELMESTDMAVVVSAVAERDRRRWRRRVWTSCRTASAWSNEDLDDQFKDPDDPLRIVFVCAMWMTGFDAPATSTIYLDKPMRNHTLMQTIARANRVFQGKQAGLIVDYIGVFRNCSGRWRCTGRDPAAGSPRAICRSKSRRCRPRSWPRCWPRSSSTAPPTA